MMDVRENNACLIKVFYIPLNTYNDFSIEPSKTLSPISINHIAYNLLINNKSTFSK